MSQTQINELLRLTQEESSLMLKLSEISRKRVALLVQEQPKPRTMSGRNVIEFKRRGVLPSSSMANFQSYGYGIGDE